MSTTLMVLFQVGNFFFDINLVLKLVGMLFIYSFVRSHVQHPILSLGLIVFLCAFLLFDFWVIFGGALILYLLAIFGVLHILVDLSFMHAFTRPLLNIGGMLSPKRSPPPPMQQQQYELETQERARRAQQQGYEEDDYGNEQDPSHRGDHAHPAMRRQEMEQRQRMEYERMRRSGSRKRTRDDERGR